MNDERLKEWNDTQMFLQNTKNKFEDLSDEENEKFKNLIPELCDAIKQKDISKIKEIHIKLNSSFDDNYIESLINDPEKNSFMIQEFFNRTLKSKSTIMETHDEIDNDCISKELSIIVSRMPLAENIIDENNNDPFI